jgi:TfoX/Sxy family transcriptional regulator of competence genes
MAGRECHHCKQWIADGETHDCWTTTEAALTLDLSDDLRDAWDRLLETAASFGDQRIYASRKSIMFSRQSCYLFVRPKRSSLELCVFVGRTLKALKVRRVERVSKSKLAHFIRITHRDEVEAPITDWLREAYEFSDELLTGDRAKRASKLERGITVKDRKGERTEESHRPDGAKEKHAAAENPLIDRIRAALSGRIDFLEKRMFGGVTFMVREKMCISAGKGRIMCRIDPDVHESALKREGCRTVIMKGRQYRGYVYVDEDALKAQSRLDYWVNLSLEYNGKPTKAPRKRR